MSQFLKDLNQQQQAAVTHKQGPLLILAGAGSGKTRALTYRAAYLLDQHVSTPEQILLTTFTNKAAKEMQARLTQLVGFQLPFAGTFHSLSARFLRRHALEIGRSPDFVIFDPQDQLETIKEAEKQLNIDSKEIKPNAALYAISSAKSEMVDENSYGDFARGEFQQQVSRIYRKYQQLLRTYNAFDFDDLLLETIRLFQQSPTVADRYQTQFRFVLVDEYQDTNKAQYQLTKLFSKKHRNLGVVGDASQSIYSWRGADFRNLQLLKEDFPDLTTIKLEQNYRSTSNILDAAYGVIAHNSLHPILSLWTEADKGDLVAVYEGDDEYDEIRYILKQIDSLSLEALSQIAILFRTNAQSRLIEEMFIRAGIPYVLVGGVKFYQRKEVKDVLAYIRYSFNQKDEVSRHRILKLGKRRFQQFQQWLQTANLSLSPLNQLDQILKATAYLDKFDPKNQEDLARIDNVNELRSVASNFDNVADFLENIALVEQDSQQKGYVTPRSTIGTSDQPSGVVLMTLHASKGLEFERVFLIGMEEGIFPHSRSLTNLADLEEERRLCYVGITRAKKQLYLSYSKQRVYFGNRMLNPVSRFIGELPKEVITWINPSNSPEARIHSPNKVSHITDEMLEKFLNDEMDIEEFISS